MLPRSLQVNDFQDKYIRCCDCQDEFNFTAGEQAFYLSKGLAEPKRCLACRHYRKVSIVTPTPTEKLLAIEKAIDKANSQGGDNNG